MRASYLIAISACVLFLIARPTFAAPKPDNPEAVVFKKPVRIRLEGIITGLTHEYMKRQIEKVRELGADLIIVDIDSPGGDAQASLDMAQDLARIDWAKTVAYIDHQAMSGGAFVALGCEEIIMRGDAIIGDAGPIVQGEDSLFRHAPEKIVSFLAAALRSVAQLRHHPPALAEAMIDKNLEVFYFHNKKSDTTECLSQAEVTDSPNPGDWEKVKPVFGSGGGRFLTLNGKAAVETGLAVTTVAGWDNVKERFGIEGNVPVFKETGVDTALLILNLPIVTGLLLVLGFIFLFVELYAPGLGIFGILSGACFVLFFWSHFLGGTADWLEILLFVGGIACIAVELFLFPGLVIFGVSGFILVMAGLTMAIVPHAGEFTNQFDMILESAATVGTSIIVVVVASVVLARFLGVLPFFKKMLLQPPSSEGSLAFEGGSAVSDTSSGFAVNSLQPGQTGITRTPLRPSGKARIDGQEYDVVAEGSLIPKGKEIRVILVQGNRIVVREVVN